MGRANFTGISVTLIFMARQDFGFVVRTILLQNHKKPLAFTGRTHFVSAARYKVLCDKCKGGLIPRTLEKDLFFG